MSSHRKQAENWLRKNCQNALEMSLKCFETMSADERISVLQYGILNDQSQGRNGKRKTIKTMKRIFLNINRSYGIDILNDEEYRPVMVTLYNTYFPPASKITFKILFFQEYGGYCDFEATPVETRSWDLHSEI